MSLVKLSVMRSSFTNPIIFTGQDALEAGIVRNEVVIINERSYTESFSVIYDQNLEPAMVLGQKILAKISENAVMREKREDGALTGETNHENIQSEPGEQVNNLAEPLGNAYRMVNPIRNVWSIQIEIGGGLLWAVLDPYSRLSYIQYEVRKQLLNWVRMDKNFEICSPGTLGVLKDVKIIKNRVTKVDLRILKKGFGSNPVKLGQDWLERNKIGIQWYQGQNHLFFPADAVVPDDQSIMGDSQGATATSNQSYEARRRQEITHQRAIRKEERRQQKARARERKEKRDRTMEKEGVVKAGYGSQDQQVQEGRNWYRYPAERDLWKQVLEREQLKTGGRAILSNEETHLAEANVYVKTGYQDLITRVGFDTRVMTELPAAVVIGRDWFKNHVDEIQEGHEPLLRVYDDKMRALVRIWELGKMELARRNYQELQDIRAVKWEECDVSYICGNEKQFWMRAPMEEVSVEFRKGQRIHTIGDNAMVAGMIVGEEIRVGIGERWHVDFKVVFDKHLPVNMVLGKRDIDKIGRTKIRVIRKG
ncbi:hypothetical protein C8J56DRAFT_974459 [Mycena floridula]|nr:hypothetical protein C8J56DRAFT_974459 [Mycena floridula]